MSLVLRLLDTLALDSWVPRNPFSIFGTAAAAGGDAWLASDASAFASTRIESRDTAGAYVFRAALPPGATKEEVAVEVDEGSSVLVIAGERSARREEERGGGWRRHVVERSCATFLARFHLPDDAAVDGVRAALEAGVLTVTVPKVRGAADAPALVATVEAPAPVAAVDAGAACGSDRSSRAEAETAGLAGSLSLLLDAPGE